MGRARVGPVILEEPADVTSQVVKSTKQSVSLYINTVKFHSFVSGLLDTAQGFTVTRNSIRI